MTTTPQTITNLGTGGTDLNAVNGSTSGADSNDSKFLDWNGENYIYAVTTAMTVPDEVAFAVTDLDVRVRIEMDTWSTGAAQGVAGQWGSAGNQAWNLRLGSGGGLTLQWTADGSTLVSANSTVAPTYPASGPIWLRYVLDVNNGGVYNVLFYTAPDSRTEPTSWTQLGSTVVGGAATSIFNSTDVVRFGSAGAAVATGALHRLIIKNGIDGTSVLDVDTSIITSGAATSLTALTGQTVTISRPTSGRKTVAVVSPVHLFGSDDYWEIADNALLDFSASDSFTVIAVVRQWATAVSNGVYVGKAESTGASNTGYLLYRTSSAYPQIFVCDGTLTDTQAVVVTPSGALEVLAGVRNRSAVTLATYSNSTTTSASDTVTGSLSNAFGLRVGRRAGAGTGYQDFELLAVAVFRRALSATEIASITTYYQARLS